MAKKQDTLPDNWDPDGADKDYYRDSVTGDLGWMVRREGKSCIRLDRPNQEITRPFSKSRWEKDQDHRPMSKGQAVQVAFAADKQLCVALGLHDKARKDWQSLSEAERAAWMDVGPSKPVARRELYRATLKALARLTGKG